MTWRAIPARPYNSVAYGKKQGMTDCGPTMAHAAAAAAATAAAAVEDIKAGLSRSRLRRYARRVIRYVCHVLA